MRKLLMTSEMFAIRHKPTGRYMPQSKSGRGFTAMDLEEFHSSRPRLFWTMRGANYALKCWLLGTWTRERVSGPDWNGETDVIPSEPPNKPDPTRRAEEMEVVQFMLQESEVV